MNDPMDLRCPNCGGGVWSSDLGAWCAGRDPSSRPGCGMTWDSCGNVERGRGLPARPPSREDIEHDRALAELQGREYVPCPGEIDDLRRVERAAADLIDELDGVTASPWDDRGAVRAINELSAALNRKDVGTDPDDEDRP